MSFEQTWLLGLQYRRFRAKQTHDLSHEIGLECFLACDKDLAPTEKPGDWNVFLSMIPILPLCCKIGNKTTIT